MSEEIIKVLDYITEKLGVAIDWSTENALPYVEEILGKYATYNIVKHSIWVAVGLLIMLVLFCLLKIPKKSKKTCIQAKKDTALYWYRPATGEAACDEDTMFAFIAGCGFLAVIGLCFIVFNAGDLIKWSIVPEIALLEEIQTLIG